MVNYDEATGTDPADLHTKTQHIKCTFDRKGVKFFFSQLEMMMETAGVLSQWQKRLLLQRSLPPDIIAELEDLLIKKSDRSRTITVQRLERSLI